MCRFFYTGCGREEKTKARVCPGTSEKPKMKRFNKKRQVKVHLSKQKVQSNSNSNSVQLAPGLQSNPTLAPRSGREGLHTRPDRRTSSASTRNADKVCEHVYLLGTSRLRHSLPLPSGHPRRSITTTVQAHCLPPTFLHPSFPQRLSSVPKRNNPAASSTNHNEPQPQAERTPSLHEICLASWPTLAHVPANAHEKWSIIFCRHRRLLRLSVVHRHFHPSILLL